MSTEKSTLENTSCSSSRMSFAQSDEENGAAQEEPHRRRKRSGGGGGSGRRGSHQKHQVAEKIRPPHGNDVLCGRGTGIVTHPGNRAFRDLVKVKKEEYNLASSAAEKNHITKDIISQINSLDPPGRFLEKDESNRDEITYNKSGEYTGYWIETSMAKAMAKTAQALREGGPQIRAKALKAIEEHRAHVEVAPAAENTASMSSSTSFFSKVSSSTSSSSSLKDQALPSVTSSSDDNATWPLQNLSSVELKAQANRVLTDLRRQQNVRGDPVVSGGPYLSDTSSSFAAGSEAPSTASSLSPPPQPSSFFRQQQHLPHMLGKTTTQQRRQLPQHLQPQQSLQQKIPEAPPLDGEMLAEASNTTSYGDDVADALMSAVGAAQIVAPDDDFGKSAEEQYTPFTYCYADGFGGTDNPMGGLSGMGSHGVGGRNNSTSSGTGGHASNTGIHYSGMTDKEQYDLADKSLRNYFNADEKAILSQFADADASNVSSFGEDTSSDETNAGNGYDGDVSNNGVNEKNDKRERSNRNNNSGFERRNEVFFERALPPR